MSDLDELLGLDWGDIADAGKTAFPYIHTAGAGLLSAFGGGALVAPIASLEQRGGLLPAQAAGVSVAHPDYVVVLRKGSAQGDTLANVGQAVVAGGKRFDGNGYRSGEAFGKHFSFGFDAPARVDLAMKDGKTTSMTDVDKIIFCGGVEAQTKVTGEAIGWSDWDWKSIFYDPAGGLYRYMNQGADPRLFQSTAQNAYWGQQRAAQQPFLTATQQRTQSGQTLQQALLAEKAARAAQAAAQLMPPTAPAMPPMPASLPAVLPAALPQPDPSNPGYLTDGNIDPNYQAPMSVMGSQRRKSMSDEFDLLGDQVIREICGDTAPREALGPGVMVVGDLGRRGLAPGESLLVGDLGRRGLEPGVTLVGSYLYGCDVLGAPVNPPRRSLQQAGIVVKTTPKGRTFTSLVVNRQAKHNPKKTLVTARTVAKRMQQVGARGMTAANTIEAKAKTSVKGAVPARRRAPKMAPAALRRLAQDLLTHSNKLGEVANKYEKSLATASKQLAAAQKRAQAVTKVHGLVDVVGDDGDAYFENIVGLEHEFMMDSIEILGDMAPVPDPFRPGLLTDGSPDPAYGGGYGSPTDPPDPNNPGYLMSGNPDPAYGAPMGSGVPGPPDYGAGPAPDINSAAPQPFLDYQPGPDPQADTAFYDCPTDDDLPLGAIVFDGSRQPPFQGLGNYTVFFGMLPDSQPPKGGPKSGYEWHGSGGFDWALVLQGTQPSTGYDGGKNYDKVDVPGYAMVSESQKNNWGPLIGNPNGGWTRGLRFSASGPNGPRWFWFFDQAPDWAKQPILQARLNDAIVAYQVAVAAGKTDFVNQQIQDQLDAQDAAKAAKAQAVVDAQVAQAQEVEMQREAEAQARQAEQQSQLDLAAQQQADQFQAQQNAAAASYLRQHPELMFVDQGDGQGPVDDGSGMPPEMQDQGADDGMTPMNLDDQQIDWGE